MDEIKKTDNESEIVFEEIDPESGNAPDTDGTESVSPETVTAAEEEQKQPEEEQPAEESVEQPAEEPAEQPEDQEPATEDEKPVEAEIEIENDEECPGCAEKDAKIAELEAHIAELEAMIEELTPYRLAAEANEKAQKTAKLTAFAEKNGLPMDDHRVCAAIEALNYEALVELALECESQEETPERMQAASFDEIKMGNASTYLYERGTYNK